MLGNDSSGATVTAVSGIFYSSVLPVICGLGMGGNVSVLVAVNSSYSLSRVPAHRYLTGLAAVSSIFLAIILLMWAEGIAGWPLYNRSLAGCKILTWLGHASDFASAWLASALTFDRLGALRKPNQPHSRLSPFLTRRAASLATRLILTAAALWSTWSLALAELVPVYIPLSNNHTFIRCSYALNNAHLFRIFHNVDTFVVIAVPCAIILLINIAVFANFRRYLRFQELTASVRFSATVAEAPPSPPVSPAFPLPPITAADPPRRTDKPGRRVVRPAELQMSRTLLVLTSAFVLLNFPSYVLRLLGALGLLDERSLTARWLELMAMGLYYFHHAFLFLLYILLSSTVRAQVRPALARLVECWWLKPRGQDMHWWPDAPHRPSPALQPLLLSPSRHPSRQPAN